MPQTNGLRGEKHSAGVLSRVHLLWGLGKAGRWNRVLRGMGVGPAQGWG